MSVIVVRGDFDDNVRLAQVIDPLIAPVGPDELILDMTTVRFVKPFPIVTLITMLSSGAVGNKKITLRCPKDPACSRYLAACGFLQYAQNWVEIEGDAGLRSLEPSYSSTTLLTLTCLEGTEGVKGIISQVSDRLDTVMGTSGASWHKAVLSTIKELCVNIFEHAETERGWIYAQKYHNRYDNKDYVDIAIGDAGCGIRRSLARRYKEFASQKDADVLLRMLRERLSRHERQHHGMGYYILQRAAQEHDGRFLLRSGTGLVKQRRGKSHLDGVDSLPRWAGTQLRVVITCP